MKRLGTLQGAAVLFIATWVVHTADHARRGIDATTEAVVWAGTFTGLLAAVSITLILVKHPTAPMVASAVFLGIAAGAAGTLASSSAMTRTEQVVPTRSLISSGTSPR